MRPLNARLVLFLVCVAMLPDADYVLRLFSDTLYLRYHRGITHSVLLLPLWAWLCYSLLPNRRGQNPRLPWLIAAALATHIMLDLVTSFGTMILAPFSDWRATLDLVFIIDPLFSGTLLLPLILTPVFRGQARLLALAGLVAMFAYLGLALVCHVRAIDMARQAHPDATGIHALPQPFSPFRWQLIASYPQHESRAFVDLWPGFAGTAALFPAPFVREHAGGFTMDRRLRWQRLTAMRAVPGLDGLPGIAFYRWFARFPVLLRRDAQVIEIGDLRFDTGMAGESAFRLRIETGNTPRAWLVWHDTGRSEVPR